MRKGSSVCLLLSLPSLHQPPPPCYIAVPFIMTSMELLRCPPARCPYLNDDLAEEEKHRRILFAAKFFGGRGLTLRTEACPELTQGWPRVVTGKTTRLLLARIAQFGPPDRRQHSGGEAVKMCIGFRKRKRLFTHNGAAARRQCPLFCQGEGEGEGAEGSVIWKSEGAARRDAGLSPASLLPSANARASAEVDAVLGGWAVLMWDLVHGPAILHTRTPNLKSTYLSLGVKKERGEGRDLFGKSIICYRILSSDSRPQRANNGRTGERTNG